MHVEKPLYEIKYKYCIYIGGINFPFNVFHSLHQFPFISFLFWVLLLYSRLALVNDVLYSFLPQSQFIHLSIYMIIAIYRKFSSYRLVIRRIQPGTEFRQDCIWIEYLHTLGLNFDALFRSVHFGKVCR